MKKDLEGMKQKIRDLKAEVAREEALLERELNLEMDIYGMIQELKDQREIVRDGLYTPGNTLSYGQISARGFMVKMIDERLSELKKEGY